MSKTDPTDAIVALALLKTGFDLHRTSYMDNFNRLTAECLRQSESDVVSAPDIQSRFRDVFGLRIPLNVVHALLLRANKRGLLYREGRALRIDRAAVAKDNYGAERERALAMHQDLVDGLTEYVRDHFGKDWTEEQAELALQQYLSTNALPLFRSTTTNSLIRVPHSPAKEDRYILASYVNHLVGTRSPHFESLRAVVEGTMLANAILLPVPDEAARKFKNTRVYFDTRVLLRALGYAGPSLQAPAVELLEILYETGADLRAFNHTVDEMRAVLRACARTLAGDMSVPPAVGETYDYFQRQRFTPSDVYLLVERLDENLHARRIQPEPVPPYDVHTVDETALEAAITSAISYSNRNALVRDISSISAIIRLRRGSRSPNIEDCRAIFVTLNSPLRRAANDFYRGEDDGGDPAPVAVSDWVLANLLWLKRPNAVPDLPRKRIVADFYAAVQPSDEFRRRYLDEIEKLQKSGGATPTDVFLLAHSLEARSLAYDKSLGDDDAVTQATVAEVLEAIRADIESDAKARVAAADARLAEADVQIATVSAHAAEAAAKAAEEAARAATVETRLVSVGTDLEGLRARELSRNARQLARIEKAAVALSYGPFTVGVAAVVAAVYLTLPLLPAPVPQWLPLTAALFIGALTLVGTFWGGTLSGFRRVVEVKLCVVLRRVFAWFSGEDAAA